MECAVPAGWRQPLGSRGASSVRIASRARWPRRPPLPRSAPSGVETERHKVVRLKNCRTTTTTYLVWSESKHRASRPIAALLGSPWAACRRGTTRAATSCQRSYTRGECRRPAGLLEPGVGLGGQYRPGPRPPRHRLVARPVGRTVGAHRKSSSWSGRPCAPWRRNGSGARPSRPPAPPRRSSEGPDAGRHPPRACSAPRTPPGARARPPSGSRTACHGSGAGPSRAGRADQSSPRAWRRVRVARAATWGSSMPW